MTERTFTAPTPQTAQRMTRNLRSRGYAVHLRGRVVRVQTGTGDGTLRTVAQRYAAVEVKHDPKATR